MHTLPLAVTCMGLSALVLLNGEAFAQAAEDPIAPLVGSWDIPGTRINVEIRPNRVVQHWALGTGDISHENASFYKIMYHQHDLICRYEIKRYGENEISFVVASQPSPDECNLGVMRRSPETSSPPKQGAQNEQSSKEIPTASVSTDAHLTLGTKFRDCPDCPEMVAVPSGSFLMGSPSYEGGRRDNEGPQRRVVFNRGFAVGRFPVTVDEFRAFVYATGHRMGDVCNGGDGSLERSLGSFESPPGFAPGFTQSGKHPVVCVSWYDAKAFVVWLSKKTNKTYRLLTEAEREYVARAGTTTPFWWGSGITPSQALYDTRLMQAPASGNAVFSRPMAKLELNLARAEPPIGSTAAVDQYQPNDWGLYQVHGNIAEWTEDCWTPTIASSSSSPAAVSVENCSTHVLRGGAWSYPPAALRAAFREYAPSDGRYNHVGFRVARDTE